MLASLRVLSCCERLSRGKEKEENCVHVSFCFLSSCRRRGAPGPEFTDSEFVPRPAKNRIGRLRNICLRCASASVGGRAYVRHFLVPKASRPTGFHRPRSGASHDRRIRCRDRPNDRRIRIERAGASSALTTDLLLSQIHVAGAGVREQRCAPRVAKGSVQKGSNVSLRAKDEPKAGRGASKKEQEEAEEATRSLVTRSRGATK